MYRKKMYCNKLYRKKIYSKKIYRKKVHSKNRSVISNKNKSATLYKCLKHPSFQNGSAKIFPSQTDYGKKCQTRHGQLCTTNYNEEF